MHLGRAATDPEAKTAFRVPVHRPRSKATCIAPHGSKPGADFAGKSRALECRRLRERPVAPEKLLPITRERARRLVDIEEDDAVREFGIVIIARQQRASLEIHFGLHVEERFVAQVAQHPFAIAGDGKAARTALRRCASFKTASFTGASIAT